MPESIYKVKQGDLFLQSKHADVAFTSNTEPGFGLFWFDEPKKGKSLCVEYISSNWPALYVTIQANWKTKRQIAQYRRETRLHNAWAEGTF